MIWSHPTRVRGLKSLSLTILMSTIGSRTLHGCVDWNTICKAFFVSQKCRTLHGCVDWNFNLKSGSGEQSVAPYTGAWIEILVIISDLNRAKVAPYTGAWIEIASSRASCFLITSHPTRVRGLKLGLLWQPLPSRRRTLHGCVDWNWCLFACRIGTAVAPYTGAWIEIGYDGLKDILNVVAPYTGAWIEIA